MVVLLYIVCMDLDGKMDNRFCFSIRWFLFRSPVLVAMALREAGMNRQESIDFVRKHRRGSFNVRQLEFLQNYHSNHRLTGKPIACLLM